MVILAQIFGILAIITFAISPQQKTKHGLLIYQFFSAMFYAIQYFLLGAYSAVATNILGAAKNLVFSKYAKKNKKIPLYFLILYILILIVAGILTYKNIFSIFPIILSILYSYGTWQDNLKVYRIIAVFGGVCWTIYNFTVGAYVGAMGNIFQLISAVVALWRFDISKSKKKTYN